jgi:ribose 5-phosphate isomerase B
MKIVFGADDTSPTVDEVESYLRERGHDVATIPQDEWPEVARLVGEAVASGEAEMGVLMCWTGTGTSMMANKVPGVRAALCWEAWIAEGARKWNDANVLVMSLKRVSPEQAVGILDAWFSVEGPDADEEENIKKIADYEEGR